MIPTTTPTPTPTTPAFRGFGERALEFYEGLAADNSRTYWQANRAVHQEHVAGPLQALTADLAAEFGEPKVFRPNRDVRFTPDKRPYQEFASAAVERGTGGSLYLSLSVEGLLLGGGFFQPARDQLERFRDLQDDPAVTADLDRTLAELAGRGYPLAEGAPVRTAPRGRRSDHPRIDLIRRTSLTVSALHPPGPWLHGPECLDVVVAGWRAAQTWNAWLDAQVGPSTAPPRRR